LHGTKRGHFVAHGIKTRKEKILARERRTAAPSHGKGEKGCDLARGGRKRGKRKLRQLLKQKNSGVKKKMVVDAKVDPAKARVRYKSGKKREGKKRV